MADEGYKIKKIELNKSGVIKLLKSQDIMDGLQSVAIQQGYTIDSEFVGFDRCHVVCKESGND